MGQIMGFWIDLRLAGLPANLFCFIHLSRFFAPRELYFGVDKQIIRGIKNKF